MAIAWMYREDYARSGYSVLPRGRGKARFMGWQAVIPTLVLVAVSVAALVLRHASPLLTVGTLLLSLSFFISPRDSPQSDRTSLLVACCWSR